MFEKMLGEVKGIFNIITIFELVITFLFILIGLIFFSNPSMSDIAISIFTGMLLIGNGVSTIFAFLKRGTIDLFNNNLVYGVIFIIIGIISLFFCNVLLTFLGIYFIIIGIQKMNYAFFLKKFNESSWLITCGVGIIFIVIGIVTFFTSDRELIEVVGICLTGFGIIKFINTLLLRRRSKYFIA